MKPQEFRDIRERLGLTQEELSEILGLSGYKPVSHYETGVRRPSEPIQRIMRILDEWPKKKSEELREALRELGKMQKPRSRKKS